MKSFSYERRKEIFLPEHKKYHLSNHREMCESVCFYICLPYLHFLQPSSGRVDGSSTTVIDPYVIRINLKIESTQNKTNSFNYTVSWCSSGKEK